MYAPDLICVCIDGVSADKDYLGEIWDQYDNKPLEFRNMTDMLLHMEKLYDKWNFPQSSTQTRTFRDDGAGRGGPKASLEERHTDWIWERKGRLATFVVHVKYRQNAEWQGDILWVERQKKVSFDSSLTLVKLIDNAVSLG